MRIRKQQPSGNAGGESSGANSDPGSQEHELDQSSRGVKEKPGDELQMLDSEVERETGSEDGSGRRPGLGIERVGSTSRFAFTWLDKLRHSKGFTEKEPYSNLEDFITSLSKDGGSSSKGRTVSHEEVVVESDQSRLHAQRLARYNSACSELSSKQASGVGPETTLSSALVSCDDSSISAVLAQGHQLLSDASLPSAFKHSGASDKPIRDARKEALKAIRKGYAGTSSGKPLHDEITSGTTKGQYIGISRSQLATGEAGFKQGPGSSIAKPTETRVKNRPLNDLVQGPIETSQRRSHRNKSITSFTDAETSQGVHDAATVENVASAFSPDHPAMQPKDSLAFSLYTVCLGVGKTGLTAREALSEILQQDLSGLEEQGAVPSSRRVAKLLRNSPYYVELGEGKFALCSAVIDPGEGSQLSLQEESKLEKALEFSTADVSQIASDVHNKAQAPEREVKIKPGRIGRPKKLKYMKQDNVGELGKQCNRTDGKGWVCPLLAKPGYQLCDHHLDKLRCKPGSRSKKKRKNSKLAADEPEQAMDSRTDTEPPLDTAGHE